MSKENESSGVFHNGKALTNAEYAALLAQAQLSGQEVVYRTELGKQHAPSRWVNLGNGWEGRVAR